MMRTRSRSFGQLTADQDRRQAALANAADEIAHLSRLLHPEPGHQLVDDHAANGFTPEMTAEWISAA